MDLLVTLVKGFFLLANNAIKSSILGSAGVVDSTLSLLGGIFPRCLSVGQIGQLVTHRETVRGARSV